jgi:DNA repair exonuclease SbcCD ATPase subunit
MSDPSQEIKDLILALDKKLDGFDRKFEAQIVDLKSEIRLVKTELQAEISLTRSDLHAEINSARAETRQAKTEIEGKIAELSGKMDGYGKRLDQQEFVSRGAVVALVVGVTSGFIKYLFFST